MNLIIYGIGEFANLMHHYFASESDYNVVAFCVDKKYLKAKTFNNLPVVDFEGVDIAYPPQCNNMFVAIGYSEMRNRILMYEKAKLKSYKLVNFISGKSNVDISTKFGENNVVLAGTVIEPFVEIGNNNIIWSSCVVSHDVIVKNHCFLASKSLVGGFVRVDNNCFLGFNSTTLQNITIERESLVGANSLIIKNTNPYSKNIGSPATQIDTHEKSGILID